MNYRKNGPTAVNSGAGRTNDDAQNDTRLGDTRKALEWLLWLRPDGPWVLTSIIPDGNTETQTFRDEAKARAWIDKYNGKRNLYYSLNPTKTPLTSKAKKADIACAEFAHADIDPVADETPVAAKARTLAKLDASSLPKPSGVVDSGNGLQLLWRLAEPADIAVEAVNKALANEFEGDESAYNIDRILRLPGTVNLPNKKKLKAGRTPCVSSVVRTNGDSYPLSAFPKAHVHEAKEARAEIPTDDLPKIDVDTLPCSDEVKKLIREGAPRGKRSHAVWNVARALLRIPVPDATIASVLLDKRYAISDHVLEQSNPRRAVERTIGRARLSLETFVTHPQKGFIINDNQQNIRVGVAQLGIDVRYDEFSDRILITGLPGFGPALDDAALDRIWLLIDERFQFRPTKDVLRTVVCDEARRGRFHPVLDYLQALVWDGGKRIDTWLTDYGGVEKTDYSKAIGALWLTAAVRRVRQPGCKFDEMLILEDPVQGTDKSGALSVLAVKDDWFTDHMPLNADAKRVIEAVRGHWIIEAGELSGMRKTDVESLKGLLARRIDKARLSYDRLNTEWRRQCVFAGTTNSTQYLKDTTGNRRFWPVRITKRFDLVALRQDRDQLWAEAAVREAEGGSIRLDPKLWPVAAEEQEERLTSDPYLDELRHYLGNITRGKISASAVWEILDVKPGHRTQDMNRRMGDAIRMLGWRRPNKSGLVRVEGNVVSGYVIGEQNWPDVIVYRDRRDNIVSVTTKDEI